MLGRLYRDAQSTSLVLRLARRLFALTQTAGLQFRSLVSRQSLVDPLNDAVVVSLTSYGSRTRTAHLAVESVGRGSVRPGRLILWLDDQNVLANPPKGLRQAQRRGLEIRSSPNFGPHTKYYLAARDVVQEGQVLVTADDDIYYPSDWLARLIESHRRWPADVLCYRAHHILVGPGGIEPYLTWPRQSNADAGPCVFATGVSGVLYPYPMVALLAEAGEAFAPVSLRNDDLWLHHVALTNGIQARQIGARARHFLVAPGTRDVMLASGNVEGGGNDAIIARLYSDQDVELLRDDGEARSSLA